MKNKMIKRFLLLIGGSIVFSVLLTGIVYRFFPQYLCYSVYDASEGDVYQKEEAEMNAGSRLTEHFVPQNDYLMGVNIEVRREENDNKIIGRLLDSQGKLIVESSFSVNDAFYEFSFGKWVKSGQEYQLEIVLPEENRSAVMITLGPNDTSASEHRVTYIDGAVSGEALYVRYIYGTYSKKLLVYWLLVLFLCGFMIGEALLYKYEGSQLNRLSN